MELKHQECYFYKTDYKTDQFTKVEIGSGETFTYASTRDLGVSATYEEINKYLFREYRLNRTDCDLVKAVEAMGKDANGIYSQLENIEIPDGVQWVIQDYDGIETIHEKHRSW